MTPASAPPSLRAERECWDGGAEIVVGIDEVGRGAWAGPVTVGALVVPTDRRVYKVRDSKLLTPAQREALFDRVAEWSPAWGVGHAHPDECDALGMTEALRLAGERALADVRAKGYEPDRILLDGHFDYLRLGERVTTIVKGDMTSLGIAAASILAKVTRDRLMVGEAEHFPGYGFETNVGYPAPLHQSALAAYGPTSIHRRSWIFMESLPWFRCGPAQPALF